MAGPAPQPTPLGKIGEPSCPIPSHRPAQPDGFVPVKTARWAGNMSHDRLGHERSMGREASSRPGRDCRTGLAGVL